MTNQEIDGAVETIGQIAGSVFFDKVASLTGIRPVDEKQAAQMLELADLLYADSESQATKTAADGTDFLSQSIAAMQNRLGVTPGRDPMVVKAAAAVLNHPGCVNAFRTIRLAEAANAQA